MYHKKVESVTIYQNTNSIQKKKIMYIYIEPKMDEKHGFHLQK